MLPTIDIQEFRRGDAAMRGTIAQKVADGCQEIGFLYAVNHGVPGDVIARVRGAVKDFFARPEAEKRTIERPLGQYRGYIPMAPFSEDTDGSALLMYEALLQGAPLAQNDPAITASKGLLSLNLWPAGAGELRAAAEAYWDAVDALSQDLLQAFALALGLDEDALTCHFQDQLTNISYLHYPPRPEAQGTQSAPKAHFDTNALTVLLPDAVGGLEVQTPDGSFAEVTPLEGAFVVNIGNMMEAWSGGQFKSTMHRVNPPPGVERSSIGFFAVPSYDTVIEPLVPGTASEPLHVGRDLARFVAICDAQVPVGA